MTAIGVALGVLVAVSAFIAGYAFKGFRIQQQTAAKQKAIDEEMDRRIDEVALRYRRLRDAKLHEQMKEIFK